MMQIVRKIGKILGAILILYVATYVFLGVIAIAVSMFS